MSNRVANTKDHTSRFGRVKHGRNYKPKTVKRILMPPSIPYNAVLPKKTLWQSFKDLFRRTQVR